MLKNQSLRQTWWGVTTNRPRYQLFGVLARMGSSTLQFTMTWGWGETDQEAASTNICTGDAGDRLHLALHWQVHT